MDDGRAHEEVGSEEIDQDTVIQWSIYIMKKECRRDLPEVMLDKAVVVMIGLIDEQMFQ